MAQAAGAWKKMSSWADESEAADDTAAAVPVMPPFSGGAAAAAAAAPEDAFPSLEAAAKPGKKKNKKLSLAEFTTGKSVGPGAKRSSASSVIIMSDSNRLTSEELMMLPTGPKERSAEELSEQRLGGGFRGYGGFRGGDREPYRQHPSRDPGFAETMPPPPPPSRADESSDWMSGKSAAMGMGMGMARPSSRGGGGSDRDMPSKADEVDDWNAGKKPVQAERSYGFGGGDRSWGGGRGGGSSSERWSFRDSRQDVDRWSGGGGGGGGGGFDGERKMAMERPRLNLQPRSLPLDPSSRPSSSHSSRPGTPASASGDTAPLAAPPPETKRRSNPFGAARPREMVLEERGQDWRKIDLEIDSKRFDSKELTQLKEEIAALKETIEKEGNPDSARDELQKKELELEQLVKDLERKTRVSESRRGGGRDDARRPPSSHSNRSGGGGGGGGGAEIWKRPPTPASMSDTSSITSFDVSGGWRRESGPRTPSSMQEGDGYGIFRRGAENGARPGTPGFQEEEWRRGDQGSSSSWRSLDERPKSGQADMWSRPMTPSENGRRSSYHFHDQQQQHFARNR